MKTLTLRLFLHLSFLCCASAAYFLPVAPVRAATLDPTFGSGGRVNLSIGSLSSQALRVFVQPGGRILVVGVIVDSISGSGFRDRIAIAALLPNGSLDPTFNGSGIRIIESTDAFGSYFFFDAQMQSDGKLILLLRYSGGMAPVGAGIVRLNADGSNDDSFSANLRLNTIPSEPRSVTVRSDGKILVGVLDGGGNYIVRLNPNGSRDQSFGVNGVIPMPLARLRNKNVRRIRQTPDDKSFILFGDSVVARLDSDSNIDRSFGTNGIATVYDNNDLPFDGQDLAIQSDGKAIIGGRRAVTAIPAVARLSFRGKRDSGFGENGIATVNTTGGGSFAYFSVFPDVNGKIIVSGSSNMGTMVAELSSGGIVLGLGFPAFPDATRSTGRDAIKLPDGSVIVVGFGEYGDPTNRRFTIAKYLSVAD